jgi:branched-chain amino acid transport system ATP-binding protein
MTAQADGTALAVDQLSLAFGGIQVLDNISAVFTAGEISGVIGPNGAGKTSFFNCLSGLYTPQRGQIRLGGVRVDQAAPTRRALLGFSRSFQHVSLCPELTLLENVALGLYRQSQSGWASAFVATARGDAERAANGQRAREALAEFGIAHVANEYPSTLAPGICRLAEIARAMVSRPRVLLLDEPAAGLNSAESRELARVLKQLRMPALVLIIVEHDMELVMAVCDTIHVLNFGKLLASGSPAQIRTDPEVIRVYLGDEDD